MSAGMLAVVPVRGGVVPLGADEVVAEADGAALIVGSDCAKAAIELSGVVKRLWTLELGPFGAGHWAAALVDALGQIGQAAAGHLLLSASPDGRDLAPRLAAALDRELVAGAIGIDGSSAELTRFAGRITEAVSLSNPVVATLQPGVRGVEHDDTAGDGAVPAIELSVDDVAVDRRLDPQLLEELPADPSTMDLAEADRIIGGGAGLGSPEAFEQLAELAGRLGASPGGTRVVTDWGWLPVERQIGTTGVTVNPSLYIAIGISGAVQHTAGLGSPSHVISVNSDPHCPMMSMADLAIVCDGPEFLQELLSRLPES